MERPAGIFFFWENDVSLELWDIYFVKFDDFDQYFVLISLYLSQTNEMHFGGAKISSP